MGFHTKFKLKHHLFKQILF